MNKTRRKPIGKVTLIVPVDKVLKEKVRRAARNLGLSVSALCERFLIEQLGESKPRVK